MIAGLLLVMSGDYMLRDVQMGSVMRAAARIEQGGTLSPQAVAGLPHHVGFRRAANDCRGALAASRLQLAALDTLPADVDPRERARLLDAARGTLAFALACSPLDGMSWLYHGRIGLERDETPDDAIEALRLSSWIAPAEAAVLFRRLSYLQWLDAVGFTETDDLFAADLRVALLHLNRGELALLYSEAAPSTRAIYRGLLSLLDDSQRAGLEHEFDHIDAAATP